MVVHYSFLTDSSSLYSSLFTAFSVVVFRSSVDSLKMAVEWKEGLKEQTVVRLHSNIEWREIDCHQSYKGYDK